MAKGKLTIYSAVLKQEKPTFKAASIHQQTGLSRALVRYHLENLVKEGFLEKDGMYYCLVARNQLLDVLTDVSKDSSTGMLEKDLKFIQVNQLNTIVEDSIAMRSAKMNGYRSYQDYVNEELDILITALKRLQRFHNSKTVAETKALNFIEDNLGVIWPRVREVMLEAGITENEFSKRLLETMGERG